MMLPLGKMARPAMSGGAVFVQDGRARATQRVTSTAVVIAQEVE